jgi:tetratricopeptide (TPR) repeat protein
VAALDHWAEVMPAGDPGLAAVLRAARLTDPDPWRDQVRSQEVWADPTRLGQIAAAVQPKQHSPQVLILCASKLSEANAAKLLRRALLDYPRDFWLHVHLGVALPDPREQIGCFQAALAIRPDSAGAYSSLGNALYARGDVAGAIDTYRKAIDCNPQFANAHYNLGVVLDAKGDAARAIDAFRKAIACNPHYAHAHNNLGNALYAQRDLAGAIDAYRKAIDCDPKDANAHYNLGIVLDAKGDVAGAIDAWRKATDCNPQFAKAHYALGNALHSKGDAAGAIDAWRKATDCNAQFAEAHFNLGVVLDAKGDVAGAIDAYRKAIDCNPQFAKAHFALGNALHSKGDVAGAIDAYRKAIDCNPKLAGAHCNLGSALHAKGDVVGAIDAFRQAIACNPQFATAHWGLGVSLRQCGALKESVAALTKAKGFASGNVAIQQHLQLSQRWLELDLRLPGILAGKAQPASPAETTEFAEFCLQPFRKQYAVSLKLYKEAFAADPHLELRNRYDAARAALLVAAGQEVKSKVATSEAAALRHQAQQWLLADLAVVRKAVQSAQLATRQKAHAYLARCKGIADLVSIRDAAALKELPAEERQQWQQFWAEVDELLDQLSKPGKA